MIWGIMQVKEGPDLTQICCTTVTLSNIKLCDECTKRLQWYRKKDMLQEGTKINTYCINFGDILDHTL